jgi:HK97 family phage major capsid protein
MKTSAALEAERIEALDEAESLFAVAESESRDLTAAEQSEVDALQAKAEALATERDSAAKRERFRDQARKDRLGAQNVAGRAALGLGLPAQNADANSEPRIELRNHRSKHFKNARDAHVAGCWMQYQLSDKADVRQKAAEDLQRFDTEAFNVMTAGAPNKGSIFIPSPMVTEIIKNRDSVGITPQIARFYGMSSETLIIPEETTRPSVYYPGETQERTASDATVEENELKVKERACLVKLTKQLIADAAISAADYVVDTMSYELAYAMDNELINGDGTSTYGREEGLLNQLAAGQTRTAATGSDTLAELINTEWTQTIAELPGKYQAGRPAWIMSRETWAGSVLPLSIAAGGNTVANMQAGLGGLTWLGYPVFLTDLMPAAAASTVVALFGDWSRAVALGDRGDMQFEVSNDRYFEFRQIGILATHRYDILVHNNAAYSALKTAA